MKATTIKWAFCLFLPLLLLQVAAYHPAPWLIVAMSMLWGFVSACLCPLKPYRRP